MRTRVPALVVTLAALTSDAHAELLNPAHLVIAGPTIVVQELGSGFRRCGMDKFFFRKISDGSALLEVYARDAFRPVVLGRCPETVLKRYKRVISMQQIPASTD